MRWTKKIIKKVWVRISDSIRFQFLVFFCKKPDVVVSFGYGLGDDLLCTIVIKQLRESGYKNIWMKTHNPAVFQNNPNVKKVIRKINRTDANGYIEKYLSVSKVPQINPWYATHDVKTGRDEIPSKHIIKIMCEKAGVAAPVIFKPYVYLSEEEAEYGRFFDNQICIQSTGKGARSFMSNKEWFPERFAALIAPLGRKYKIIQIGSKDDDLLDGVVDLRGKTTIRQTAGILKNSQMFIGLVGFLMHLARSVECRSVIIYGGREHPDQSGYQENINLYAQTECSPCWYWNSCEFWKKCMEMITVEDVLEAVRKIESSNIAEPTKQETFSHA